MEPVYMNFVYYNREAHVAIVLGNIRYVWGDVDIRDYISEDTIQNAEDIVISANGGNIRVLHHDMISTKRKYQVITEFTSSKDIKSKYILICPNKMSWNFNELTSEGFYDVGDRYIEIVGNDLNEMDILNLSNNLSYMYGIRFVPHTIDYKKVYRITLDEKKDIVWNDIEANIKGIKKAYKFDNIYLDKARKSNYPKPKNNNVMVDGCWEW